MSNHTLGINTILHTKDGRKIGNAIIVGRAGLHWELVTDYGNKVTMTSNEIDKYFYVAFANLTKEHDGYDCTEMQELISQDHKHRVNI